jgi:hypothetical protein
MVLSEYEPLVVRGGLVALHRVKALTKPVQDRIGKRKGYDATLTYLRGREALPSPLFADRSTRLSPVA